MQGKKQGDKRALEHYKMLVEQKLGWGDSTAWRNQDFLALSSKIQEQTGVLLSNTTLKRIWGKLEYSSTPNSQTLNALARFVGFDNWLEFCAGVGTQGIPSQHETSPAIWTTGSGKRAAARPVKPYRKWITWTLPVLVGVLLASSMLFQQKSNAPVQIDPESIQFSSKAVSTGIPNTVVFEYDVSQVSAKEVEIQQSWDERRRFMVAKEQQEATSVYYLPGYFRAKLLVDGQVVREHDLFIKSEGWLATLNTENPQPRYFSRAELEAGPGLSVSARVLEREQLRSTRPLKLGFHYVDDFGDLSSDNFTFETTFRNTSNTGAGLCRFTRIMLLCTDGVLIIPFSIPGCVGDLRLVCNDVVKEGRDNDLSALGCAFSDWATLRLKVRNKKIQLALNGQPAYELEYHQSAGRVVGMRYLFEGNGEVRSVRLSDATGSVVFEDQFER